MPNLFTRALGRLTGQPVEGEYRPGPYHLPYTGGWLSHDVGQIWNWWQCGYDPVQGASSAMVEACISAYAQTVAMLPGDHWRAMDDGGRERVTTSALFRILRSGPNDYESISDFLLGATRHLMLCGNAYALAGRNDRNEITELHLMAPRQSGPSISPEGAIFYHLGGNEIAEARFSPQYLGAVPARDVLHIRLNTDRNRLLGESPVLAALPDIWAAGAITAQQFNFYLNQARPSFAVVTPEARPPLTEEQINKLRDAVNAQKNGGVLILNGGIKPAPIGMPGGRDAQTAEVAKTVDEHIALALGVPLQVLGLGGVTDTEAVMNFWLARGLGFVVNHIELAFDRLFGLTGQPVEYVELDTQALLRSAHKAQIDAAAAAIKGGVKTVNEARETFQLGKVKDGDEIRVQAQDVPLSAWKETTEQKVKPATPTAAPAPAATAAKEPADEPPPPERLIEWFRRGYDRQLAA